MPRRGLKEAAVVGAVETVAASGEGVSEGAGDGGGGGPGAEAEKERRCHGG